MIVYRDVEKLLENTSTHVPMNDVRYCTVQAGVQSTITSSGHSGTTPVHSEKLGQQCSAKHLRQDNVKNSKVECECSKNIMQCTPVQSTKVINSIINKAVKTSTHNLPCNAVQLREQMEHLEYNGEESTLTDQLTCNSVLTDSMQRHGTQEMQCCATDKILSQFSQKVPSQNSTLEASKNYDRVQPSSMLRLFDPSCHHLSTNCTASDNTDNCLVRRYNTQKQTSSHPSTILKQENSK